MYDPYAIVTIAVACLIGLGMASYVALKGWNGWLQLKRLQFEREHAETAAPSTGSRIEVADLKERVRKLEAIAAGIEL